LKEQRVLLVDDDMAFRSSVKAVLEHLGADVVCAENGRQALHLAEDGAFDLVITDLRMADMDGLELLRRLRRQRPELPVVVATGYASLEAARQAVREGAADFLTKPFSVAALQDALEVALRRRVEFSDRLSKERLALKESLQAFRLQAAELPPAGLLREVLRSLCRQTGSACALAAMVELNTRRFKVVTTTGCEEPPEAFASQAIDAGLLGRLFSEEGGFANRRVVSLREVAGKQEELDKRLLESGLTQLVRLVRPDRPVGFIALTEGARLEVSEEDLPVVEMLTTEAEAMLVQQQSSQAVKTMSARLAVIDKLNALRARGLEHEELLREIVHLGQEVLEADEVLCFHQTGDRTLEILVHTPGFVTPQATVQALAGRCMEQAKPVLLSSLREAVHYLGTGALSGLPASALLAPLHGGRSVLGALVALRHEFTRPFETSQLSLLMTLAAEIGLALESASLHREAQQRSEEVEALSQVSNALSSTLNLEELVSIASLSLTGLLNCDLVAVTVAQPGAGEAVCHLMPLRELSQGALDYALAQIRRVHETVLGKSENFQSESKAPLRSEPGQAPVEELNSVELVPLLSKSDIVGVLAVFAQARGAFSEKDRRHLATVGSSLAVAIRNSQLYTHLKRLSRNAIRTLGSAIEAKDPYTQGHSERVGTLARLIGQRLGMDADAQEQLEIAGYLHDVGKIGIREGILGKPGRLSEEEFSQIRLHPVIGARIVEPMQLEAPILAGIRHHHERMDGRGYPDGLAGDDVPKAARVLAVADTFDALTSDRPYRPAVSIEKALQILREASGTQLDGEVVEAFCALVSEEPLPLQQRLAAATSD